MTLEPNTTVLVHLASGIGNIVLATPLLIALSEMACVTDVLVSGDYAQTADLFRDWSIIRHAFADASSVRWTDYDRLIPAIPPFYWARFQRWHNPLSAVVPRPPSRLFYEDEQEYYLSFSRELGYAVDRRPFYQLPISPSASFGVTDRTLAIVPGCKTGEMAAKRWPHFPDLAEAFDDVVVVGTSDDLLRNDGSRFEFPRHVRVLIGRLTLRETAEVLATAGAAVGNDSGLSHVGGAVGTPIVMIFGPTPHETLGTLPPNVKVMRAGLDCEPCWFGSRFAACSKRIDCLYQLTAETVVRELLALVGNRSMKQSYSRSPAIASIIGRTQALN